MDAVLSKAWRIEHDSPLLEHDTGFSTLLQHNTNLCSSINR